MNTPVLAVQEGAGRVPYVWGSYLPSQQLPQLLPALSVTALLLPKEGQEAEETGPPFALLSSLCKATCRDPGCCSEQGSARLWFLG